MSYLKNYNTNRSLFQGFCVIATTKATRKAARRIWFMGRSKMIDDTEKTGCSCRQPSDRRSCPQPFDIDLCRFRIEINIDAAHCQKRCLYRLRCVFVVALQNKGLYHFRFLINGSCYRYGDGI